MLLDVLQEIGADRPDQVFDGRVQAMAFPVKNPLHIGDGHGQWQDNTANVRYDATQVFQGFDCANRSGC